MSAVDLLPCPFCGEPPFEYQATGGQAAACDECGFEMLADDWNRRAPVSAGKVKALAEAAIRDCEAGAPISAANLARDVLASLQPGDGWQGIESAPKDGTEFLIAYSDGTVRVGRYLDNSGTAWPWQGVRPMYGAESAGAKITYWMPFSALGRPPASLPQNNGEGMV